MLLRFDLLPLETSSGGAGAIYSERRKSFMLLSKKNKGQGLIEYSFILVLVAIVVIAALMIMGPTIGNAFSTINASL